MRTFLIPLGVVAVLVPALLIAQDIGTNSAVYCPNLTVTLQFGSRDSMTGGQVTELQKFLVDYYDLNPDDYMTGYFGRMTRDKMRQFQCERMNICSGDEASTGWGVAGGRTRAVIAEACGGGSGTVVTPSNRSCRTPWGTTVEHTGTITAYQNFALQTFPVQYQCRSEVRTCNNSVLSGTYTDRACPEVRTNPPPASNMTSAPSSGHGPLTVQFGGVVQAGGYSIEFGDGTSSGDVGCAHGGCPSGVSSRAISTSHTYTNAGTFTAKLRAHFAANAANCAGVDCNVVDTVTITVSNPPIVTTTSSCTTPWGTTLEHGGVVTAYASANNVCQSQLRLCTNGVLSGSYTSRTCTAVNNGTGNAINYGTGFETEKANDGTCLFHHMQIKSGAWITAYELDTYSLYCKLEIRHCNNGVLSGEYKKLTCPLQSP